MKEILKIILYSVIITIIIVGLEKIYNSYENKNKKYKYEIQLTNLPKFKKTTSNINIIGIFYDYTYQSYKTGKIYYKENNIKISLYDAIRNKKITIDEILREMTITPESKNTYWTLYLYDGKGKIGNERFSILKCNNSYIFSKGNIQAPDKICLK